MCLFILKLEMNFGKLQVEEDLEESEMVTTASPMASFWPVPHEWQSPESSWSQLTPDFLHGDTLRPDSSSEVCGLLSLVDDYLPVYLVVSSSNAKFQTQGTRPDECVVLN